MTRLSTVLAAAALSAGLAAAPAHAQEDRRGPYLTGALGSTSYDYDCGLFSSCGSADGTSIRLSGAYRFGVFAVEAVFHDYGRASIRNGTAQLHMRSLGLNAVWHWQFAPKTGALLRVGGVGLAGGNGGSAFVLGLGLTTDVTPTLAVDLGADGLFAGLWPSAAPRNVVTLGVRWRI